MRVKIKLLSQNFDTKSFAKILVRIKSFSRICCSFCDVTCWMLPKLKSDVKCSYFSANEGTLKCINLEGIMFWIKGTVIKIECFESRK